MNAILRTTIVLAFFATSPILLAVHAAAQSPRDRSAENIVVVELFTSQGCSSCPPADRLLGEIRQRAEDHRLPVSVLSFHVDYWNSIGWEDPFSSSLATERQKAYAKAFRAKRIYTPQMIVNGQKEFVGSDGKAAIAAINRALTRTFKGSLRLEPVSATEKEASFDWSYDGQTKNRLVHFAIVQKSASNDVARGENAGRKLSHVNVVRHFRSVPANQQNESVALKLPTDVSPLDLAVFAYVQNAQSMRIETATRAAIPNAQ